MTTLSVHADPSLTLAERSYRAMRDRLIMLDIAPGAPLQEALLAEDLGVGRTPLREAMKRLEIDHLVATYPRRGTFATPVDITELAAVSEVRVTLEPLAAGLAAERARGEVREALRAAREGIEDLSAQTPWREVMAQDLAVHRLLYGAAGNHHLEESLIRLDNLATRIWCVVVDRLPDVVGHIKEHASLLDAVLEGDAERAASLSVDHIRHFDAAIREVL